MMSQYVQSQLEQLEQTSEYVSQLAEISSGERTPFDLSL